MRCGDDLVGELLQLERGAWRRPDLILWCIAVHAIERIPSGQRITVDREGSLRQLNKSSRGLTNRASLWRGLVGVLDANGGGRDSTLVQVLFR